MATESGCDSCYVIDVTRANFKDVWPTLIRSINRALFVAVDIEMSGIGNNRQRGSKNLRDRYTYIREMAQSRSVLSMGLACFCKTTGAGGEGSSGYEVLVFDISLMSNSNYIIEPRSATFLAEHGFDFNKQIASGVRFSSGGDGPDPTKDAYATSPSMRLLFKHLMDCNLFVVHNGLIDMIYMYQAFFADLPQTLDSFVCDLSFMFKNGILDTKYVADFVCRESSSFLEYLFRKYQRDFQFKTMMFEHIRFPIKSSFGDIFVDHIACGPRVKSVPVSSPCLKYAAHGFCRKGLRCALSHDLDDILDNEEVGGFVCKFGLLRRLSLCLQHLKSVKSNARKRKRITKEFPTVHPSPKDDAEDHSCRRQEFERPGLLKALRSKGHRSGFDAFMTGYIYASYMILYGGKESGFRNKIYVGGSPRPLIIATSGYTSPSLACKSLLTLNAVAKQLPESRNRRHLQVE